MAKIQWDESLAIGVELIDEQHKQWLDRLDKVSKAVNAWKGPDEVVKTLDFLVDYTNYHFSTEEKYMTQYEYPRLEDHKGKHEELKTTLSGLLEDFEEEGATQELANAVDTLLVNWLTTHIKEVDQYFAEYLEEQGIALPTGE